MRDGNEKLNCGNENAGGSKADSENKSGDESGRENDKENSNGEKKSWKKKAAAIFLLILILILILLCFRSCRARDEPLPDGTERVYEEDHGRDADASVPAGDEKRLNLAVAGRYQITDEEPYFYIGFPAENAYDVVFALKDEAGNELYKTNYVSAGTNVAIDGTAFLAKGEQKVDCLVSVYDHNTGALVSDCTTVVLNISYR